MKSDIQTIKGEYKPDEKRIKEYYKKSILTYVKQFSIPWLLITILLLSIYTNEILYVILGFIGFVALSGIIWYAQIDGVFEKTKIIFDDYRIVREGVGLTLSKINYKDIGKIIIQPRGIIIVEKGFLSLVKFYSSPYSNTLTSDDNVIFIPYLIRDYELIKDFFQKKKYNPSIG